MKVAIFIVAYNAENTIEKVLNRIPDEICKSVAEVFIFDDCSQDQTTLKSSTYDGPLNGKITIFKNQVNLGYGGNQKRGYRYAMEQGHDVVVLLHGDGQYAPECIKDIIAPILKGEAQAVFGSRMIAKGGALSGGMPLYKYVGNKILTGLQNYLLPGHLSEFHSGYRAYHVPTLKKLPLLENTNDFYFDTEIIIQLMEDKAIIKEIAIPTYYGDEICHVDGLHYAFNVVKTTFSYNLHKKGLLYDKRFDLHTGVKYTLKSNKYSSHQQIIGLLPDNKTGDVENSHVLDVGCGSGLLAKSIIEKGHLATGIDVYNDRDAEQVCDRFIKADLENGLSCVQDGSYDHIVFADVLEHVRNPEKLLLEASQLLNDDGTIIASTGNVGHILIRFMLLFGRFEYTERGILDRTHVRLFTKKTFRRLVSDCAFEIIDKKYCPIPFENIIPGHKKFTDALSWFYMLFVKIWPSMFAYQMILVAKPRSDKPSELMREQQILDKYTPFYRQDRKEPNDK